MKRLIPGAFFLILGLAINLQAQQNQPKLSIISVAGPAGVFMVDAMEEEMAGLAAKPVPSLNRALCYASIFSDPVINKKSELGHPAHKLFR